MIRPGRSRREVRCAGCRRWIDVRAIERHVEACQRTTDTPLTGYQLGVQIAAEIAREAS